MLWNGRLVGWLEANRCHCCIVHPGNGVPHDDRAPIFRELPLTVVSVLRWNASQGDYGCTDPDRDRECNQFGSYWALSCLHRSHACSA